MYKAARQWEVADWLRIHAATLMSVSEDSKATAQRNMKGWADSRLSPGPRGQSFKKMLSLSFLSFLLRESLWKFIICAQDCEHVLSDLSNLYRLFISLKFSP